MLTTNSDKRDQVQSKYTTTISGFLMLHVRKMYLSALDNFRPEYYPRIGINFSTPDALPAYVLAVEALESFLNETFIVLSRIHIPEAELWKLSDSKLRKLINKSLKERINLIPQLLLGKTIQLDSAIYRELGFLISIRNKLVHYMMEQEWDGYVQILVQRNIGLNALEPIGQEPWPQTLNTSEGIRWANNTVCEMAIALQALLPESYKKFAHQIENFMIIDESLVKTRLELMGISPSSSHMPGKKLPSGDNSSWQ